MNDFPKFLLDSGDPLEFREISELAKSKNSELWGATTNPTLIAKKLEGRKVSMQEAFELQKQIVLEIIEIVPGAVSAEVYADEATTADEMIEQGRQIATWHKRVVVKLPTNVEGFKARTALRKEKIPTNNTLVFSQEQIFAICLHERIVQETFGPLENPERVEEWPPFISPFVGRLDDIGEDGMSIVENGMKIKELVGTPLWMLEASVRRVEHIRRGIEANVEIITAPGKVLQEWFSLSQRQQDGVDETSYAKTLTKKPYWNPSDELLSIETLPKLMDALEVGVIDIVHPLTDKGLIRFANDWKEIIAA